MARTKRHKGSIAPPKTIQRQEIIRCGKDPIYFINKYVKIQHPLKGLIPFNTFDYQDDCVNLYEDERLIIINKSRQLGLSTISAAYSLWMCLFSKDKNILIIATKLEVAKNFMRKVFCAYDNLPGWLVMPKVNSRTVKLLEFSNGSKVQAIPTSVDAGRSEALSLLIIDEAAHVENMADLWVGLGPTLSTGGRAILISTPNGVGNTFHKIWAQSEQEENDFSRIELPWEVHPERDEIWYKRESSIIRAARGERGVQQEFHCDFNASGDTFLKAEHMEMIRMGLQDPIAKHPRWDDVWIWKYAIPEHKYLISADVARGDAADFSTAHVIDTDSDEIVCEYRGKIVPDRFADILFDLGMKYNSAMICPEKNSFGLMTGNELKKMHYPNLYYEKLQKNLYMAYMQSEVDATEMPGFTTNSKTRQEMMAALENALRNQTIRVYSKRLYEELKTFIWNKKNKAVGMKGYNDDLVMALAIGLNLYESSGSPQYDADEVARAFIMGMSVNQSKMSTGLSEWGQKTQTSTSDLGPGQGMFPGHPGSQQHQKNHQQKQVVDRHLEKAGVQDWSNPYWEQFRWLLD